MQKEINAGNALLKAEIASLKVQILLDEEDRKADKFSNNLNEKMEKLTMELAREREREGEGERDSW